MCAEGQIAINVRGLDLLQAKPGEDASDAWTRMKGKLGTGKHLDETIMLLPDAVTVSGGKTSSLTLSAANPGLPASSTGVPSVSSLFDSIDAGANVSPNVAEPKPANLFAGGASAGAARKSCSAPPTSSLNLLGHVESWGIGPATNVNNIAIKVGKMTGAQLQALIKHLPDGVTYALDLEKEESN